MVAATRRVTSISDWKKELDDLTELPSGKLIRMKRSSMNSLLAAGIVPNSLMAIVQSSIDTGKGVDSIDFSGDPQKIQDMMKMMDDVVVFVVKEPEINSLPTKVDPKTKKVEDKNPALLYVDEIDDEDKMFIFQYATGGTKNLEQFREQIAPVLATVQSSSTVARPTKRAVGTTKRRG